MRAHIFTLIAADKCIYKIYTGSARLIVARVPSPRTNPFLRRDLTVPSEVGGAEPVFNSSVFMFQCDRRVFLPEEVSEGGGEGI